MKRVMQRRHSQASPVAELCPKGSGPKGKEIGDGV
jgi:hypothetical protein